jgi:hypothetical protein
VRYVYLTTFGGLAGSAGQTSQASQTAEAQIEAWVPAHCSKVPASDYGGTSTSSTSGTLYECTGSLQSDGLREGAATSHVAEQVPVGRASAKEPALNLGLHRASTGIAADRASVEQREPGAPWRQAVARPADEPLAEPSSGRLALGVPALAYWLRGRAPFQFGRAGTRPCW